MISVTNQTHGISSSTANSYNTASVSPAADTLIIVDVMSYRGLNPNHVPTGITGASLTFAQIGTASLSDVDRRTTRFWALAGSSPGSGVLTINFGAGNPQVICGWSVNQITGAKLEEPRQSIAQNNGGVLATSFSIMLAALANAQSLCLGAFSITDNIDIVPGSGFTQLSEDLTSGVGAGLMVAWKLNDTAVGATCGENERWTGVASEIEAVIDFAPQLIKPHMKYLVRR